MNLGISYFERLPAEVMMKILEYVSHSDLLNMSLVSRMLYLLSTDPGLWKEFKMPKNLEPETLISTLNLSRLQKLNNLHLQYDRRLLSKEINPEQTRQIFKNLEVMNLKTLIIEHFDLTSLDSELLSNVLRNVEFVSLKNEVTINDDQVLELVMDIPNHGKLKIFQAKEVDFSFIQSVYLSKAINSLKTFDNFYCEFIDEQLETIFNQMAVETNLKQLTFFSGYYDDLNGIAPEILAKALNNLEWLYIGYCSLSPQQLLSFFQQLSSNSNLGKINFFFQDSSAPLLSLVPCNVLSKGLNNVEEAVIPYLELSDCQMKKILEDVAKDESKIKILDLGENVIPDLGLEVLKKLLIKLEPNEFMTNIRRKLIEELEKIILELKIKAEAEEKLKAKLQQTKQKILDKNSYYQKIIMKSGIKYKRFTKSKFSSYFRSSSKSRIFKRRNVKRCKTLL